MSHLTIAGGGPDAGCIEALEHLLERAKAGEIRGVVAFCQEGLNISHTEAGSWEPRDVFWQTELWRAEYMAKIHVVDAARTF